MHRNASLCPHASSWWQIFISVQWGNNSWSHTHKSFPSDRWYDTPLINLQVNSVWPLSLLLLFLPGLDCRFSLKLTLGLHACHPMLNRQTVTKHALFYARASTLATHLELFPVWKCLCQSVRKTEGESERERLKTYLRVNMKWLFSRRQYTVSECPVCLSIIFFF